MSDKKTNHVVDHTRGPITCVRGVLVRKFFGLYKLALLKIPPGDFGGNSWEVPGGAVEAGESKSETLEREVSEESGVIVKASETGFVAVDNYTIEGGKHAGRRYRSYFQIIEISGDVPYSKEHEGLAWVDLPELDLMMNLDGRTARGLRILRPHLEKLFRS